MRRLISSTLVALSITAFSTLALATEVSQDLRPEPVTTLSTDGIKLALKHYARPGAPAVLLVHGLAQNDRCWDAAVEKYSFAKYLHARGFDVWIGNLRNAGTAGFRSESPRGPRHWTIEDYTIRDLPALIAKVRKETGRAPFVLGHSLAAWAIDGYLSGVEFDEEGNVRENPRLAARREREIAGVVSIAGVYNLWWPNSLENAVSDPIRTAAEYYQSNYEMELLASSRFLFHIVPRLPSLPLNWVRDILTLPVKKIPFIGDELGDLYDDVQSEAIKTPILSMFYFPKNMFPEAVRLHALDGLEDLGPKLIEQLANTINSRERLSHYHLESDDEVFSYDRVKRSRTFLPFLFVGGARDRLANSLMIYQDGYLRSTSVDKKYHEAESGHLDILSGVNAEHEVWAPVADWIDERTH